MRPSTVSVLSTCKSYTLRIDKKIYLSHRLYASTASSGYPSSTGCGRVCSAAAASTTRAACGAAAATRASCRHILLLLLQVTYYSTNYAHTITTTTAGQGARVAPRLLRPPQPGALHAHRARHGLGADGLCRRGTVLTPRFLFVLGLFPGPSLFSSNIRCGE